MSGAVPASWKIVELGDVGTFLSGGTPSKEREDYWGGAIPWVTARDLKRTFLQDAGLTLTELGASGVRMAPAGAIFLLVRGMTLFKDFPVSVALRDMAFNQDIKALVVDKAYNSQYVAYQLIALKRHVMALVDSAGHGTGRLDTDALKGLPLKFPSLPEQTKIAEFLGVVDARLTALMRKKGGLERFKSGLMQQLFTQTLRFTRDDGTDFPDWEERQLGEMLVVTMGQSPDSGAYNDEGDGLPLIQGNADISNRTSAPRRFTSEVTKVCEVGDILISVRAPIGEISLSAHRACLGRGIAGLRSREDQNQSFWFQFLLHQEPKWQNVGQGSTFSAISGPDIRGLLVLAPHPDEQRKIADALSALDAKINGVADQIAHMQTFKQGLLQQMFV